MLDNRFGDFYGGVLHPLTALEHALPILALGLLAGQQGERAARWLVLTFPLALLLGAVLATVTPLLPSMSLLNAVSFVVLGLLVAAGLAPAIDAADRARRRIRAQSRLRERARHGRRTPPCTCSFRGSPWSEGWSPRW